MHGNHAQRNTLLIILWLGLVGCIPAGLLPTSTIAPPSVGPRQITENTLGLREYWRVSSSFVGDNLAAVPGRVVYTDHVSNVPHVRVLDAANGDLLWEVVEKWRGHSVATDAERVYVEDHRVELRAYDIEDGQKLWTRQFTPHRGRSYDLDGNKLYIQQGGNGEDYLYTIDTQTGEILSTESLWTADHFLVFARFPQFDLHILTVQNPFTLRAVDPATQQTLWQVEQTPDLFIQNLTWPPVLLDDVLLIDTEWKVIAFDAQSGQVRWRSPDPSGSPKTWFVTRSVLVGGSLYALRSDTRLVQLDARTGQEIGYIQFKPPLPDDKVYGGSNRLGLATDGQMLFVSLDDSQELIALGP
jgi:outer membrane protein assembly factor BamB